MAVYRSKQRDPLSERLIDAGIGTVIGFAVALVGYAVTLALVFS